MRAIRELFSVGMGRLVDAEGIDWWDLTSLSIVPEAEIVLTLRRLVAEINPNAELWATRPGWPANVLGIMLRRPIQSLGDGRLARIAAGVRHRAGLVRRFTPAQISEIFLDKYDSGFRWRSRFAPKTARCPGPVVLIPSAYGSVSRMAVAYARMLPRQPFLVIATRKSAKNFIHLPNVHARDLGTYAKPDSSAEELESFTERWAKLRADLRSIELQVLSEAGVLECISGWIRNGILARNAWREAIEREPVCGVLCGDDSNLYTRLPVLLAARRKIPTVDFHHGALDGRYLLKDLSCDVYLAKNEMERDYLVRVCGLPSDRIMIGAPGNDSAGDGLRGSKQTSAIFFSEPYESAGMRGEEVYAEVLPALCRIAREEGRDVIVKLHPFESRRERCRMLAKFLAPADRKLVTVLDGPLTRDLLSRAWFGVTVESSAVVDCFQAGVQCFLCGWLRLSPFGYVQQYARFGVGEMLQSAEDIEDIPERVADFHNRATAPSVSDAIDRAMLQRWLTTGLLEVSGKRSAS